LWTIVAKAVCDAFTDPIIDSSGMDMACLL
jgi:hypothetical protein